VTVLLVVFYVLVCIFLVLVVLLQQGKGADLAGAFGGGGSQTSFGPRSGSNIMHRMTTVSFVLFVVLSLALAILSGKQGSSVMKEVEAPAAPVAEAPQSETTEPVIDAAVDPITGEIPAVDGETVDPVAEPVEEGTPENG
jgi:preprotein translocase subunit SecG